jgi:cyanobactin maturation PatA/PatG family protease
MCELAAIPGLAALWKETLGDKRICVAVLDGQIDTTHPAFEGAMVSRLRGPWPDETCDGPKAAHGTHVASIVFGRHGGPAPGVAPGCRGLSVPVFSDRRAQTSQLDLARGIEAAVEAGAHVINVSGGQLSPSGEADDLLVRAVELCRDRNVLLVAAAGNDGCLCQHVPAALPSVLAVGAMGDAGQPLESSNWGETYRDHGILAPGENVLGAVPGGGTFRASGTSIAAPIVAGVAALLLSMQVKVGIAPDPRGVRAALLDSVDACELADPDGCRRLLGGKLNVRRAVTVVTTSTSEANQQSEVPCTCGRALDQETPQEPVVTASTAIPTLAPSCAVAAVTPAATQVHEVTTSQDDATGPGWKPLVYALGSLDYDFGNEARRDSFKQLMPPVPLVGQDGKPVDGPDKKPLLVPANPYDPRQMVAYLRSNPSEARSLIWMLKLELTPIYAIEPGGPYGAGIYEQFVELLGGEVAPSESVEHIERVSIPGRLGGRSVKLFSGQVVPVVNVDENRGIHGWAVNQLLELSTEGGKGVHAAAARLGNAVVDPDRLRQDLSDLLARVYYDLRNLGTTSADRALNYSVTNAFLSRVVMRDALQAGMALDRFVIEKSPVGRVDSDTWDIRLRFFDPENGRKARRVYRYSVDVSDVQPVFVSDLRTWTEA